jgi:hypothetical protein
MTRTRSRLITMLDFMDVLLPEPVSHGVPDLTILD